MVSTQFISTTQSCENIPKSVVLVRCVYSQCLAVSFTSQAAIIIKDNKQQKAYLRACSGVCFGLGFFLRWTNFRNFQDCSKKREKEKKAHLP